MTMQEQVVFSPAQEQAFQWLLGAIPISEVLVLRGGAGAGKTTILENVHATAGGILLGMRQFMESLASRQPYALEDALLRMIEQALEGHEIVMIDDLHLVTQIVNGCDYPRTYLLDAALTAILAEAAIGRKKLIFSLEGDPPWPILRRAHSCEIGKSARARSFS